MVLDVLIQSSRICSQRSLMLGDCAIDACEAAHFSSE